MKTYSIKSTYGNDGNILELERIGGSTTLGMC